MGSEKLQVIFSRSTPNTPRKINKFEVQPHYGEQSSIQFLCLANLILILRFLETFIID